MWNGSMRGCVHDCCGGLQLVSAISLTADTSFKNRVECHRTERRLGANKKVGVVLEEGLMELHSDLHFLVWGVGVFQI